MEHLRTPPPTSSLITWATYHGATLHPSVEIYEDTETGISLRVRQGQTLPANSTVVSCPVMLTLSHLNTFPSQITGQNCSGGFTPNLLDALKDRQNDLAALLLCVQYLKGEESFWHPYVSSLPQPVLSHSTEQAVEYGSVAGLQTPVFWSTDDMRWLTNTNIARGVVDRKNSWRQDWQRVLELLRGSPEGVETADGLTFDIWLWAASIFSSRSFTSALLPPELRAGDGDEPFPVLFPLVDIANHNPSARVTWFTNTAAQYCGSALEIKNDVTIGGGEQVWNNYAPKGNTELLLGYGFCVEDNPNDTVALAISVPPTEEMKERVAVWTLLRTGKGAASQGAPNGGYNFTGYVRRTKYDWQDGRAEELKICSEGLIELLAVFLANRHELAVLGRKAKYPMSEPDAKHAARNPTAISCRLNFHIMSTMLQKLQSQLLAIVEGGNLNGSPLNSRQYLAQRYRNGQIAVLENAIKPLQMRLKTATAPRHDGWSEILTIERAFEHQRTCVHDALHYKTLVPYIAKELEEPLVDGKLSVDNMVAEGWDRVLWIAWLYNALDWEGRMGTDIDWLEEWLLQVE